MLAPAPRRQHTEPLSGHSQPLPARQHSSPAALAGTRKLPAATGDDSDSDDDLSLMARLEKITRATGQSSKSAQPADSAGPAPSKEITKRQRVPTKPRDEAKPNVTKPASMTKPRESIKLEVAKPASAATKQNDASTAASTSAASTSAAFPSAVPTAAASAAAASAECVRILHLSDTHGLHRTIEDDFPLPPADILVHTGDFTDRGLKKEFADFDKWLASLRSRYAHIVVCYGNHEYTGFLYDQACAATHEATSQGRDWFKPNGRLQKALLPNATHVLEHEEVELCGVRFFGSSWCCWHYADTPGDAKRGPEGVHRFGEIPRNVDVLLTHGAPHGVFDRMEETSSHWGSSKSLRLAIEAKRPKAHFFGHIHEQRGMWLKGEDGKYVGGVEYQAEAGKRWHSFQPPPSTYPCELVSCNAMKNHPELEGVTLERIAGPARLIIATRDAPGQPWRFSAKAFAPTHGSGGGGKRAIKRKQGGH